MAADKLQPASTATSAFLAHTSWLCFAFGALQCLICPSLNALFRANLPTSEAQLFVRHFGLALLLIGAICCKFHDAHAELVPMLLIWHGAVTAAFVIEIVHVRVFSSSPLYTRTTACCGALLHAVVFCEGMLEHMKAVPHPTRISASAPPLASVAAVVSLTSGAWWPSCLLAIIVVASVRLSGIASRRCDSLAGQLVVITGAAGGIGRELALEFLRAGARLALWDVREEALEEVRQMLMRSGHWKGRSEDIYTSCVDTSDAAAVTAAATALRQQAGVARVVVSNAAVMRGKALLDATDAEIRADLQVNTLGSFWCARAFLRQMLTEPSPRGVLVTMGSIMAELPANQQAEYCASKAAVGQMHECLRWELRARPDARHVRSLLVLPYAVRTPMIDGAALLGEGREPCHRRFAWIGLVLPPLRPDAVARRVVRAVQAEEERVYIPWVIGWIPALLDLLPAPMRDAVLAVCGAADGIHGFRGCAPPRTSP